MMFANQSNSVALVEAIVYTVQFDAHLHFALCQWRCILIDIQAQLYYWLAGAGLQPTKEISAFSRLV